jgi:ribosome recycling factor
MDIKILSEKMDNSITFFEKELSSIRTSRANTRMLDNILVEAYDNKSPITQLGNISVSDATTLMIQVWDSSVIKNIQKAITESNLGINPQIDGSIIRLPIPKLSEERRVELSKVASQYSENAKITIRNIRRDALDNLKSLEKEKDISQDELKKQSLEIQKVTDNYIVKIDDIFKKKKTEIITV